MSKAHVRRRKGSVVADEMKLSEEMLSVSTPKYQGHLLCLLPLSACPLLPCLITLHVCYYCYCQRLDVAALLACMEPSFDTVPWRLHSVVLMCC